MKRCMVVAFVFLSLVTAFAFADTVVLYIYSSTSAAWVPTDPTVGYATATGFFSTEAFPGNVNGYISPDAWDPSYGRVNFAVYVYNPFRADVSFNMNLGSQAVENPMVDDVHIVFSSGENINMRYSISASFQNKDHSVYYQTKIDTPKAPTNDSQGWSSLNGVSKDSTNRFNAGTHSFLLWLGFKGQNDSNYIGTLTFSTYIVPDI